MIKDFWGRGLTQRVSGGGSPQKYCPSPGQQLGGGLPNTYISSTNGRADIAQRGHAKNKRFDLRLVGLALACSTDHRIPLGHIATAGNAPDAKVFAESLPKLVARLEAVGVDPASVTVVFDKGNNSEANLAAVNVAAIGFVGSLVPTQHRDLLAVPDEDLDVVLGVWDVTASGGTKEIYG